MTKSYSLHKKMETQNKNSPTLSIMTLPHSAPTTITKTQLGLTPHSHLLHTMSIIPPRFTLPHLPLRHIVFYPSNRPSIRRLAQQITDLGYLVQVHLFLYNYLQSLSRADQHWAEVIAGATLVIEPVQLWDLWE